MDLGDFETTIKVIVVGNGGVGKSSMASRYCKGVYTTTYKKTIGARARARVSLSRARSEHTPSPPAHPPNQASTSWRSRSTSSTASP